MQITKVNPMELPSLPLEMREDVNNLTPQQAPESNRASGNCVLR